MKESITIGGITAAPGEKISAYAHVPGTACDLPMTVINGREDGKILLCSAGIHGCEYPGILATVQAAGQIDPDTVRGAVVFLHLINVSGFEERIPFVVPADPLRRNLNRLYPGDAADESLVGRVVQFTSAIAGACDFHIDLHSGDAVEDLLPIVIVGNGEDAVREESIAAAKVTRFGYRMQSGGRTEYYNSTIIDHKKPALLFERGCAGTYTAREVEDDVADLFAVARHLQILPGEAPVNAGQRFTDQKAWLSAEETGLFYPHVKVGEQVQAGQTLYEIRDIWGTVLQETKAAFDGLVFILPRSLAIRKGDDSIMYAHAQ